MEAGPVGGDSRLEVVPVGGGISLRWDQLVVVTGWRWYQLVSGPVEGGSRLDVVTVGGDTSWWWY